MIRFKRRMRLTFVFLLNLLLLKDCLTANVDKQSYSDEFHMQNQNENVTKIGVLNEDFEYAIFDNSNLDEMLQFAKDARYSEFVKKHIFPVKYRDYEFRLTVDDDNIAQDIVKVLPKAINIYDYDLFIDVIVHCGQSIERLFISNSALNDVQSRVVIRYVNEYCTESLVSIYLEGLNENALSQFKKPFSKLKNATVDLGTRQIGHISPINEIFPQLQRLSLTIFDSAVDNQFIVSELSHLSTLSIGICLENRSDFMNVELQFASFFQKNPQIQCFTYTSKLGDFIKTIHKYLLNLEYFSIFDLDDDIESIQFDNVTEFAVYSSTLGPIERLSFPCLEALSLFYSWKYFAENALTSWHAFFNRHQSVRKLTCTTINSKGLVEFLAKLKHLQEIEINFYVHFDMNLTSQFIENHKNLLKFQFKVYALNDPDEPDLAVYRKRFGNAWHVNYSGGEWPTLTLEKKKKIR